MFDFEFLSQGEHSHDAEAKTVFSGRELRDGSSISGTLDYQLLQAKTLSSCREAKQ